LDKKSFESNTGISALLLDASAHLEGVEGEPSELRPGLVQNHILY
jgi:hypothetical protein